ncbi:DOMON-like domain-containing protein [Terricaulis sp.]|uniref:DOMON-like domain-containing protein n=1 Tax=Terricaulis sp. TaxID=2768686 RepID=UPI0037839CBB
MDLRPHPETPSAALTRLEAVATRSRNGRLAIRYVMEGAIGDVAIPAETLPMRMDELWKHTCFEAFVRGGQGEVYYEFNFAPSLQWAAYRFDAYRTGMSVAFEIPFPDITVTPGAGRYELTASIEAPVLSRASDWRVGLSAVIEEKSGAKSYWALAHAPGKPDFHHADAFALVLPATEQK